jgi:putative spermidine/putrescine transport system ATP-binding protein
MLNRTVGLATNLAPLPISIQGISKVYGSSAILNNISLEILSGEFFTLLGPSGSGKTTLLMAIAGFAVPDAGRLFFGPREMTATPPHKRGVGVVFQSYALFPLMTVAQNVGYPLKIRGVPRNEIARRVEVALEIVKLGGFGGRSINQLSGGQRQRVALARTIVFEPQIILMDEPLSALDKKLREQMQIEIKSLHQKVGATIVYVTHDQREALMMSDRIAVLDRGRIAQIGSPQEIYERPCNRFVAEFMNEMALLPVAASKGLLSFAGRVLGACPKGDFQDGWLVLRPDRISLASPSSGDLSLEGQIVDILFEGETQLVMVDLGGDATIRVRCGQAAGITNMAIGTLVTLSVAARDIVIVKDEAP